MNWYLVHTKPRQESCALENLQNQGYTCYLPMLACEKLLRGKLQTTCTPLFPRYLFIQLDTQLQGKSWAPIRSTKGVQRLVCFGTDPARVDTTLVHALQQHEATAQQPEHLFTKGEKVQVLNGPFQGLEAIYNMADGESRVMVLIEMLSKPVRPSSTVKIVSR
ncbi:MAG: transcription/translation regulatory transformer protein RfaH [Pusillimonas sp.]